mgnify:CR=1 FL=1
MNSSSDNKYPPAHASPSVVREDTIEYGFIGTLQGLKYDYRLDITDRASLEKNFREKFEALNRVRLTDAKLARRIMTLLNRFTADEVVNQLLYQ